MVSARGRCSVVAVAGGPSLADRPRTWNLLFARQPEPDLEFTEVWRDETTTIGSPSPIKPPKRSHRRPLLWALFFMLIGGGTYVAMESEMVTEYVGSLLGKTPATQLPVARKPAPPTPAPSKQVEQDWSFLVPDQTPTPSSPASASPATASAPARASPPAIPAKQVEQDWSFLAPDDTPTPSSPASASPATASAPAKAPPPATPSKQVEQDVAFLARIQAITRERNSVPGTRGSPAPLFSEGQRVSVRPDLNAPGWTVLLREDAEGTRPGPTISPGTVLTILDGNLQGRSWVYFVRSDVGSEGWLTEGQLRSIR
jgi:hypothetical protein